MFENVDGRRTEDGVTGILIAHLGAFGSGELINSHWHFKPFYTLKDFSFWFETIHLGRSIVNIKGSHVIIPK